MVTVSLGGKDRVLRYDVNAYAELETVLGKGLSEIGKQLRKGLTGAREIRALIWAGLIHDEPSLTLQDVGRMLTMENFERVAQQAGEAISQSDGAPGVLAETPPSKAAGSSRRR